MLTGGICLHHSTRAAGETHSHADGAHLTFISLQGVLCPAQSSCLPDFPGVPAPLRLEDGSIQCPALCCWFLLWKQKTSKLVVLVLGAGASVLRCKSLTCIQGSPTSFLSIFLTFKCAFFTVLCLYVWFMYVGICVYK